MKRKNWIGSGIARRMVACVLTAVLVCGALVSCEEYNIGNTLPVACDVPQNGTRDYRMQELDNINEWEAGSIIFQNKDDRFDPGIIQVCNSRYTVSESLAESIIECAESYGFLSGFYLIDTKTKMSCGYNADEPFFSASTVKAGYALYCFKEIQKGNGSLDETMKYSGKYKIGGSGSTQYSEFGTVFTIDTLLYRVIYNSDNVAYYMLLDRFGIDGYNEMVKSLGVNHFITEESRWGDLSPHELGLIWQEIYRFRDTCEEGQRLWELLTTNEYNEIKIELTEYSTIAHKSGWGRPGYHDAGVVCCENDYIIVVMTDTQKKNNCFYKLVRYADTIMQDYAAWCDSQEEQENGTI